MSLRVLFENADLAVFNKPAGVPSTRGENPNSMEELVTARFPEALLLHRLDVGTSGVLAFARNPAAHETYRAQWNSGTIQKIYRARVQKLADAPSPLQLPLILTLPIGHDSKSSKKMRVVDLDKHSQSADQIRGEAQPAYTEITRIHGSEYDFEIRIQTGVRHQIRAHLAHIGYPILGDGIYTPARFRSDHSRLFLHAWKIKIGALEIEAPLPDDWRSTQPV